MRLCPTPWRKWSARPSLPTKPVRLSLGQNRHLKLRFSKGAVQLEGIFFSVTTQQCPCQAGERVDVAFYLQVNEFRGSRTVQLQVVDLRPSLQSSTREEESLQILRRLEAGEELTAKEALRILPSRQQCAAAWRCLRQQVAAAFRRHSRRGSLPAGLLLPGSVLRAGAAEPGDS